MIRITLRSRRPGHRVHVLLLGLVIVVSVGLSWTFC